jgi:hypothetical protein
LNLTSAANAARNYLFNNIFVVADGQMLVWDWSGTDSADKVITQGNLYWASGAVPDFEGYTSIEDWRAASGHERREGVDVGLFADPLLASPGSGGTLDDVALLTSLTAYLLSSGSPAIDAGLDPALFGADPGATDYFGGETPMGGAHDIGAYEHP